MTTSVRSTWIVLWMVVFSIKGREMSKILVADDQWLLFRNLNAWRIKLTGDNRKFVSKDPILISKVRELGPPLNVLKCPFLQLSWIQLFLDLPKWAFICQRHHSSWRSDYSDRRTIHLRLSLWWSQVHVDLFEKKKQLLQGNFQPCQGLPQATPL